MPLTYQTLYNFCKRSQTIVCSKLDTCLLKKSVGDLKLSRIGMEGDRLDVVIFGASGFTGKYTVYEAVKVLDGLKWGIAGRNKVRVLLVSSRFKFQLNFLF
jgi:hypothetical protein